MVQKYQGTENEEQTKELILVTHIADEPTMYHLEGVFKSETAMIDRAKHNGTLYRFQNLSGEWSAVNPETIDFLGEAKQDENPD